MENGIIHLLSSMHICEHICVCVIKIALSVRQHSREKCNRIYIY